jgi:hypothetical protein
MNLGYRENGNFIPVPGTFKFSVRENARKIRSDLGRDNRTGPGADQKTIGEVVEGIQRTYYCENLNKEHNRMDNDKDRERALDLAISQIEKQFGKGAIMRLGEDAVVPDIPTISTGSLGLDLALGIGGLPRGRVAEIYGPEASGKTTMALHVVAQAQKGGGMCAYIDAEHALDLGYARKLGWCYPSNAAPLVRL